MTRRNNSENKIYLFLGSPFYLLLIILILIPIILMLFYSITENATFGIPSNIILSFDNYLNFFREAVFINLLLESLKLAFFATLLSFSIGYPIAYLISNLRPKIRGILILLITAPMWINMLIRTRALQQIFEIINPALLGTDFAIIAGMTYNYLPFMILPIYTVLSKIDKSLLSSSYDLGANRIQTFLKITFPLSISGVLSGVMMVFLPSATTLVIPKYLGEGRYLIGNLIENAIIQQGNFGRGSAIAIVMSILIFILIYFIRKFDVKLDYENE